MNFFSAANGRFVNDLKINGLYRLFIFVNLVPLTSPKYNCMAAHKEQSFNDEISNFISEDLKVKFEFWSRKWFLKVALNNLAKKAKSLKYNAIIHQVHSKVQFYMGDPVNMNNRENPTTVYISEGPHPHPWR